MKNDCVNNETITTSKTNQPFALVSGTVNAGNLHLSISPGRLRTPYGTAVTYSGLAQGFVIANAQAQRYLTIFIRPGSPPTFMVSGSTTATVPDPVRWDAQYLGQIWTGASLTTANLQGPWNQSATNNPYEQRGEAPTFGYPTALATVSNTGSVNLDTAPTSAATASGIGFLTFADRTTSEIGRGVILNACVTYAISGARQAGALHCTPAIFFQRVVDTTPTLQIVPNGINVAFATRTTTATAVDQNPDSGTVGASTRETMSLNMLSPLGTAEAGYRLAFFLDAARSSAGTNAVGVRFVSVVFTAQPGLRVPAAISMDPQ